MSLSMKSMVLLAKVQTAKGAAASPTGAANAILCRGLTPQPLSGSFKERSLIRLAKGNYGAIVAGEHRVLEFEVELAGGGAAGAVPKYGPLLMGCGLSETVTPSTNVVYQPTATMGSYLTLEAYLEGVRFRMTDALGTVSFVLTAEEIPVLKFQFIGTYEQVTDAGAPSGVVFTGFQQPLTVGKVNTPVCTLDGTPLVLKSLTLDLANQLKWVDYVNDAGVRSPDRKPVASAVFEMTTVATKDWIGKARSGATMELAVTHGVTAGGIVGFSAPALQFSSSPSLSNDNEVAMINAQFAVMPVNGNDELVLTVA